MQSVRLRFTGEKRIELVQVDGIDVGYQKVEDQFFRKTWIFVPRRSAESLCANNYEWPFELILPGDTPESIEGLTDGWIIYRMKATIERSLMQKDEVTRKDVRILRTLDPADPESTLEVVWALPGKMHGRS